MYILFFVFRRFILQIVKRYLILVSFSFCPFRKDFPVEYFPLGLFFFCVRLLQPLPASVHNPTVKCHPEWQFRLFRVDLLCFNVVSIYHPIHVLLIWIFNSLKFSNRFRGLMLRSCKIECGYMRCDSAVGPISILNWFYMCHWFGVGTAFPTILCHVVQLYR